LTADIFARILTRPVTWAAHERFDHAILWRTDFVDVPVPLVIVRCEGDKRYKLNWTKRSEGQATR